MDSSLRQPLKRQNSNVFPAHEDLTPPSRTHQYKKLMKPLMERKRRARMNVCIEEIRDLMAEQVADAGCCHPAQDQDGHDDLVSRMDKAEVLEVAVKHIHKLLMSSRRVDPYSEVSMFQQGYLSARAVINDYLHNNQTVDERVKFRINGHLDNSIAAPPGGRRIESEALHGSSATVHHQQAISPAPSMRASGEVTRAVIRQPMPVRPIVAPSRDHPINLSMSSRAAASTCAARSSADNSWRPW